jgi:hypothetical protein
MDLTLLTKDELQKAFLKVNKQYIEMIEGVNYIRSKSFLDLRKQLHDVINELQRRRGESDIF